MMMDAAIRHTILQSTIYKRNRRLQKPTQGRRKSLYQAVFAPLPTGTMARTAFLLCIKDSTNIEPSRNTGGLFIGLFPRTDKKLNNTIDMLLRTNSAWLRSDKSELRKELFYE